jgi:hypothetical protein
MYEAGGRQFILVSSAAPNTPQADQPRGWIAFALPGR